MLSRQEPPPLPGGYHVGETVYWVGCTELFHSGRTIVHGQAGEVAGDPPLHSPVFGKGVAVIFAGHRLNHACWDAEISHAKPPPLPGGLEVGEQVYWTGDSATTSTGNRITHGQGGEVTGPAATTSAFAGKGVSILFPGNCSRMTCPVNELSRTPPPPLPGGYAVGETVIFTGATQKLGVTPVSTDDQITHGQAGEVTGPVPGHNNALSVLFPGNVARIICDLSDLIRAAPTPRTNTNAKKNGKNKNKAKSRDEERMVYI